MPKFKALGEDLANIVCDFAFQSTYHDVFHSLKSYLQILAFKVPNTLLQNRVFSPKYLRFIANPLVVFEPISCFDGYRSMFDWNEVYCRLWQLDFRRAVVRSYGSRGRWHLRLTLTWTTVLDFVSYYRALHLIPTPIYKPTLIGRSLHL